MLLCEPRIPLPRALFVWCDNISALALASNPVYHAHTKHIEVDYHFVREKVLNRDIAISFISTCDQISDIFTKGLSTVQFQFLQTKLTMLPAPVTLRGDVKPSYTAVVAAVSVANSASQPQRLLAIGDHTSAQRLLAVGDTANSDDTATTHQAKTAATHAINKAIEGNKSSHHLGDFCTTSSHTYHSIKSDTKGNTPKIVQNIQGNFPRSNTASLHAPVSPRILACSRAPHTFKGHSNYS